MGNYLRDTFVDYCRYMKRWQKRAGPDAVSPGFQSLASYGQVRLALGTYLGLLHTGQLDTTPDVRYRRAWSMAVYKGKLFCGTLPSGHVFSLEAGKNVTHDHELAAGWKHLAAVRDGRKLKLYVDGNCTISIQIYLGLGIKKPRLIRQQLIAEVFLFSPPFVFPQ